MTRIGNLLMQLLSQHTKVSVPGIGLFRKKRVPARFDSESNQFLPPGYKYELTAQTGNDSHLLDYLIQQQTNSTKEEAEAKIRDIIAPVLQEIEEKGEASILPIGLLARQNDTFILYAQQQLFGLKPVAEIGYRDTFKTSDLTDEETRGAPIVSDDLLPKEQALNDGTATVGETEDVLPMINEKTAEEETTTIEGGADGEGVGRLKIQEHKKTSWGKVALWGALILALGVGVYAIVAVRENDTLVLDISETETPEEGAIAAPVATAGDSIGQTEVDSLSDIQPGMSVANEPKEEELIRKLDPAKPYNIIVGSLPNTKLALKQVELLKSRGIAAFVLESNMPGNRKKISCGSYATYEEALADLEAVQEHVNKEALIYPGKK